MTDGTQGHVQENRRLFIPQTKISRYLRLPPCKGVLQSNMVYNLSPTFVHTSLAKRIWKGTFRSSLPAYKNEIVIWHMVCSNKWQSKLPANMHIKPIFFFQIVIIGICQFSKFSNPNRVPDCHNQSHVIIVVVICVVVIIIIIETKTQNIIIQAWITFCHELIS